MRILVAGGAGYIGSHTCKALARAGHTPIVYDNLSAGHEWAVKWGILERGDLNDSKLLADVFKRHRPEAVINFAGLIAVGESTKEPILYYRNNVAGMLTLLEVMREHDVSSIVFSSTCAIYGVPLQLPIVESSPQHPINPYGRSKLMGEHILRDACAAHGLGAVALRYFNAAGADAEGELGPDHDPVTHLIPLVLQAAAGLRREIAIFGADYETPDGTCVRDYVHVTDLAAAHVAALAVSKPGQFKSYNLGTGRGISVSEVVDAARRITGKPIAVNAAPRREGDAPLMVADASLAEAELKWHASHSAIENIIGTSWRWMTKHSPSR